MDDFDSLKPLEGKPLDIRDGKIHYLIYNQENVLVDATCEDSISNRHFVVWLRKFDRKGVQIIA